MIIENSSKKAPLPIFQQTVQYFPTVCLNIILRNKRGDYFFLERKNAPAKGLFWIPGGRILNGEGMETAANRILNEETGLEGKLIHLSPFYLNEVYETVNFDEEDQKIYPKEIKIIHCLCVTMLMELEKEKLVELDFQSTDHKWQKELPNDHPYLKAYFDLVKDYL